jgi:hypothetical protein
MGGKPSTMHQEGIGEEEEDTYICLELYCLDQRMPRMRNGY